MASGFDIGVGEGSGGTRRPRRWLRRRVEFRRSHGAPTAVPAGGGASALHRRLGIAGIALVAVDAALTLAVLRYAAGLGVAPAAVEVSPLPQLAVAHIGPSASMTLRAIFGIAGITALAVLTVKHRVARAGLALVVALHAAAVASNLLVVASLLNGFA